MSGPVAAILLTMIVHVIAFVVLFATMGSEMVDWLRKPRHDDGDDDQWPEFEPVAPEPGGGGLPLPDAEQSPVRLREPGRIGERRPRRPRRPDHAPEPARTPETV
jgi:hypothetical protein